MITLFTVNGTFTEGSRYRLSRECSSIRLKTFEIPCVFTAVVAALITVHMKSWRGMVVAMGVAVAGNLTAWM